MDQRLKHKRRFLLFRRHLISVEHFMHVLVRLSGVRRGFQDGRRVMGGEPKRTIFLFALEPSPAQIKVTTMRSDM